MTSYLAGRPGQAGVPKLLCFHPAGSGASAFAGWQRAMGTAVEVLPVRLPGRETRIREQPFTEAGALVPVLARELAPVLADGRYALYGHSMGALIAYLLSVHQQRTGQPPPLFLGVGAFPAPEKAAASESAAGRSDADLIALMTRLGATGATPAGQRADVGRRMLPLFRADLELIASRPPLGQPLRCPLEVWAAVDDPVYPVERLAGWASRTTGGHRLHLVSGGHFFQRAAGFPGRVAAALEYRLQRQPPLSMVSP